MTKKLSSLLPSDVRIAIQSHPSLSAAAAVLGVPRSTLFDWRQKYGDLSSTAAAKHMAIVDELKSHGLPDCSPYTKTETQNITELRTRERSEKILKDKLSLESKKRQDAESELAELRILYDAGLEAIGTRKPQSIKKIPKNSSGSATAVFCICDLHCEENVDPLVVDGANEFNLTICEQRIKKVWQKSAYLLEFARGISDIRDAVLWLGGDIVNGYIHAEMEEANFLGPAEAISFAQDLIADGIDFLLKETGLHHIRIVTNQGNHGRTTVKKRIATNYRSSWEYLAYNNLARIYKADRRLDFQIAKGYLNTQVIQGKRIRFHHGDSIRYNGGVGGLFIPARKKIAAWNKRERVHLDVFGHYHQFIDCWDFVSCGCLVGYNAYALEIGADFQPPTQTFIVIDKEYGKVMALPVFCEAIGARRVR